MKNHMCIGCRSVSVDFWFTGQFTDTRPLQGDLFSKQFFKNLWPPQLVLVTYRSILRIQSHDDRYRYVFRNRYQSCDKIRHSNKSRRLWSCWPIFFFNIFPGSYSSVLISVIERWRTNRNLLIHKILLASPHPHPPKKKEKNRGGDEVRKFMHMGSVTNLSGHII